MFGVLCNASTTATFSLSKPNQINFIQQELAGTLLALLLLKPSVPFWSCIGVFPCVALLQELLPSQWGPLPR